MSPTFPPRRAASSRGAVALPGARRTGDPGIGIRERVGEFAEAIAVFVHDRAVAGGASERPIVMTEWHAESSAADWVPILREQGFNGDAYAMNLYSEMLARTAVLIGQQ